MVIDGTTGQNALSQLRQFHAAAGVTGLVVTKLDGSAKGGVVFALAREFGIPIRYAGIGERPEDLRVFDAEAFVDALLPDELDRKSVVSGKSVSVRVDLGGRRIIKKKNNIMREKQN